MMIWYWFVYEIFEILGYHYFIDKHVSITVLNVPFNSIDMLRMIESLNTRSRFIKTGLNEGSKGCRLTDPS